jgi:DNA-binding NtrC family response regulator
MPQHVLLAVEDPAIGRLLEMILEEDADCRVTRVDNANDAFAVVRASLHPLVVVTNDFMLRWTEFGVRCIEHADELAPTAWVVMAFHREHFTDELEAFLAERAAEHMVMPFQLEDFVAAVGRAAGRLPSGGITGATKGAPGGLPDTR